MHFPLFVGAGWQQGSQPDEHSSPVPKGPGCFRSSLLPLKHARSQTKHPGAKHFPAKKSAQLHVMTLTFGAYARFGSRSLMARQVGPLHSFFLLALPLCLRPANLRVLRKKASSS